MKKSRITALGVLAALATVGLSSSWAVDYPAVVKFFDPSCYWRLGETEGPTAAEEIYGLDAIYAGALVFGVDGAIVGDADTAVRMPGIAYGAAGYAAIYMADSIEIGPTDSATFLCWVKADGTQVGHTQLVMNRADGAFSGTGSTTGLTVVSDNCLGYHWNDQSFSYGFTSGLALETGVWNFAALSVTPTAATFYLGDRNGNLRTATNEAAHPPTTLTTTLAIGCTPQDGGDGNRALKGDIDEPAVFAYALSAEQINTIYQAGLNKSTLPSATITPSTTPFYAGEGSLTAVSGGTPPLTYVWSKDGTVIADETQAVLSGLLTAGNYTVKVSNAAGSVTSDPLTVLPASIPLLNTQPKGAGDRYLGGRVTLSVEVEGTLPLTYQWKLDGKDIPGATESSYFHILENGSFGTYAVTVTNSEGSVTSDGVSVKQINYTKDSFTQSIMERNPIAYYRFDDEIDPYAGWLDDVGEPCLGYARDFAGGNDGYYYAIAGYMEVVDGAIAQDSSKAVFFFDAYMGTRLKLNPLISRGAFTVMGWVMRDADIGYTTRGGYFGQNDLLEFGDRNSTTTIEAWSPGTGNVTPEHNFKDKEWSLVMLTYEENETGSLTSLYLDGILAAENKSTSRINAGEGTAYNLNVAGGGIFNDPATNMDYFWGAIDEVALFDSYMSAEDAWEFYSKGFYGPGAAPEVTTQPVSVESYLNPDASWTLSIAAGGTSPLHYQWYKDGQPVEEGTSRTLSGVFTEENVGAYYVMVVNDYGTATSEAANVTLRTPDPRSYEGVLAAMEPFAYWRLGEKTGTSAREFIRGLNGRYNENQTLGRPGALRDDPDTAVGFNGTSYIQVPGMSYNGVDVTMAAWIKPSGSIGNYTTIMFDRGSSAAGLHIADNQLGYHWNDTQYSYRSGLYVNNEEWNFVVMAVSASKTTFYLGDSAGKLLNAVDSTAQSAATFTSTFSIGGDTVNADRRFNGDIDEAVVFTRTLTAEEVETLYLTGLSGLNMAPSITVQPLDIHGFVGDNITLSVSALGTAPLSYQWYKDGEVIEGAVTAAITKVAEAADSGSFTVEVTNALGSATSAPAIINIVYTPTSVDLTGEAYKLWTHLKFDGTYDDASGLGNDAYDVGTVGEFGEGKLGSGSLRVQTDFDEGLYSYAGFLNELILGVEPITVSMWVNIESGNLMDLPFLCNNDTSLGGYGLTLSPGWQEAGNWGFSINSITDGTNARYESPSGTFPWQTWNNIVYVMIPGETVKVFVNGQPATVLDISGVTIVDEFGRGSLDTTYPLYIGQAGGGYPGSGGEGYSMSMLIDDLGIWRTALSDIEARSIYHSGEHGNSFDEKKPDIPAQITVDPKSATIYQNDQTVLTLSVGLLGSQPITVTWTKDGTEIASGLSTTLDIFCTEDAAGTYVATAKNSAGEDVSAPAVLAYRTPEAGYEELVAGFAPVAFWRFDDNVSSGVVVDYAGAHDGTYIGIAPEQQVAGAIAEDPSKAIAFNGVDSYIKTSLQLNSLVANREFTFTGWAKIQGTWEASTGFFGQNDLIEFGQNSATTIQAWSDGGGSVSAAVPPSDEWVMLTITYIFDGTDMVEYLYVNNEVVSQNLGVKSINASAGTAYTFTIGGCVWNFEGGYFTGEIDDVAVFPTALSGDDISLLYNVGKFGPGAPPEIDTQPIGAEIYANNGTYKLSVSAVGTPPFQINWYKDGELTSYSGESIEIGRTASNAGSWVAKVTNGYGEVESEPAVISFQTAASNYEALIASLDPWVYWRLGEAPGAEFAAEFGHGIPAPYTENNVLGLDGAIVNDPNTAISFTGALHGTAEFSTMVIPDVRLGTVNEVTYLCWAKRDGNQVNYTPLVFGRGGAVSGLNIRENNQLGYHWNDQSFSWGYVTGLTLEDGEWNLAALVVTPTTVTFYLGDSAGELHVSSGEQAHAATVITTNISLGGQNVANSNRQFKGLLDEPAIFNYALSAEQIQSIYDAGRGGDIPVLPVLNFENTSMGLVLTWDEGKLQVAPTSVGPWTTIEDASPEGYIVPTDEGVAYYRTVRE